MTAIPADAPEDDRREFIARLAERTGFQLSYTRAQTPRVFSESGLHGPDIPDAYGSDVDSSGEWCDWALGQGDLTEEKILRRFFTMAVQEVVHEALEWFRIDGQLALDPHGNHTTAILTIVDEAVGALWALRPGEPTSSERRTP